MKQIITIIFLSVLFFSCNSANNQHPSAQYEQKKASLGEMEQGSPLRFLKVKGSYHGNLLNQTIVEGEVINKATLTAYKNVKLLIIFRDKEGTIIEKDKELLDDIMKPNTSTDFKIKTRHVKGISSASFDIIDAVADK